MITPAARQHLHLCLTLRQCAARAFPALYADPHDRRLLGVEGAAMDRERLLYVLTLGVAQVCGRRALGGLLSGLGS